MTEPDFDPRFLAALARVGMTPQAAIAVVRGDAPLASTYLGGSLSAGLGNAGSDVDFQVFVDDERGSGAPMIAFEGDRVVDVQYFAPDAPADALAKMPPNFVSCGSARVAVGGLPSAQTLKRCSRWVSAVPVVAGTPPVFEPAALPTVASALVRSALDRAVAAARLADLVEAAGLRSGPAWALCGRALVELRNRLGGDLYEGHKWTWAKAARGSASSDFVCRLAQVNGSERWAAALVELRLPQIDPAGAVVHRPAEAIEVQVGRRQALLVGRRRLVPRDHVDRAVAGDASPADVVELVRVGALTVEVDGSLLDARLTSGSSR